MSSTPAERTALDGSRRRPHPWLSALLAPRGLHDPERLRAAVAGKTVLVTGASFGIGAALSVKLGAAGASVVLAARSASELESVAGTIRAAGGHAEVLLLDLMEPAQVARAATELLARPHGVDVVVHNAGKSIRRSLELSLQRMHDYQRCMAINYLGPVQLQLALLPAMLARGAGHIVNVSTVGAQLPPAPRWGAYVASKAAFDLWIGAAAPELRLRGISCSSVYLGLVHTRMSAPTEAYRQQPGQTPEEAAEVICRALVGRHRALGPWWLGPARVLSSTLRWPAERVLQVMFQRTTDSAAARGSGP